MKDTQKVILSKLTVGPSAEPIMEMEYAEAKKMLANLALELNYGLCRSWSHVDANGVVTEYWDVGPQVFTVVASND